MHRLLNGLRPKSVAAFGLITWASLASVFGGGAGAHSVTDSKMAPIQTAFREGAAGETQAIKEIQARLATAGYAPGPVDGLMGAQTSAAISLFQRDNGLPVTGAPTEDLIWQLRARTGSSTTIDDRLAQAVRLGNPSLIPGLIAAGADVESRDEFGYTPLTWASALPDKDTAFMLLEHGADPNAIGTRGWTPLMAAALAGNLENAKLLVSYGARMGHRNAEGQTALDVARAAGRDDIAGYLRSAR